jgi:hypothetical protein
VAVAYDKQHRSTSDSNYHIVMLNRGQKKDTSDNVIPSKYCLQYFNMLQTISHILAVDVCNLTEHNVASIGHVGAF